MTQYMLSVHHDGTEDFESLSPEELQKVFSAVDDFNQALKSEGHWVFAGGLQPISESSVVDGSGGKSVVTDGPFAESKEYLGGFWVIEAADLDAALELARRGSAACAAKVEVRPFESA